MLPCSLFRSLLVLWLSSILPVAFAIKGDSWCGFHMCVNATVDEHSVTYQLTAKLQPAGWMAIGFGKHMTNTHMVIVWKNRSNSTSISQRIAKHYTEPHTVLYPPRRATVEDVTQFWAPPEWESLAFKIPKNRTELPPGHTAERYIWAFSKTRPAGGDADETINMHFAAGYFELDLTKDLPEVAPTLPPAPTRPTAPTKETMSSRPTVDVSPSGLGIPNPGTVESETTTTHAENSHEKHEKLIIVHGVLVSAGFLVFLPIGSLTARWGRTLTPHWFKVHWIFNMLFGVPIITLGWLLGLLAVANNGADHFLDAHQIFGVLLYALFLVQIFLGRKIHSRPVSPDGPAHPPSNILHIALGLLIMCFAVFQTRSGMKEWEVAIGRPASSTIVGIWNAWVIILPIVYLIGIIFIPQQLSLERSGAPVIPGSYIALNDRADDTPPRWNDSNVVFSASDNTLQGGYADVSTPQKSEHSIPLLQAEEAA